LVSRGKELLESHNKKVREIFYRILKERGIELRVEAEVIGIKPEHTTPEQDVATGDTCYSTHLQHKYCFIISEESASQPTIAFHECLWCTNAGAPSWIKRETPLQTSSSGFIQVRTTYQSISHKNIFAAGDCCEMLNNPRPKAGVFAIRAGLPLTKNLVAHLLSQPLREHIPQVNFLGLISTGDKYAVASRGRWVLEGRHLWTLKDEIDRSFMKKYNKLPKMTATGSSRGSAKINDSSKKGSNEVLSFSSSPAMRCGGCGSKIGSTVLARVLGDIRKRSAVRRESDTNSPLSVLATAQTVDYDDAAVIMLPFQGGGAQIQTIDFFRSFVSDPFIFGQIAAGKNARI
jgi:selenide,water dikinase